MRKKFFLVAFIIISLVIFASLRLIKNKTILKSKASETNLKTDYGKNDPKVEYAPHELIITLNSSSPALHSTSKDFDKEIVPFPDLDKNTLPSSLSDYPTQSVEKIFKNYANPQTDLSRVSQKFSDEITSGEREIDRAKLLSLDLSKIYKVIFSDQTNILEVSQKLQESGQLENVELNYILKETVIPNDPYFLDSYPSQIGNRVPKWQPAHDYQWNLKLINLPNAWEIAKGSKKVTTAILDSGIDRTHRDLKDHIWSNRDEIPDNGIDDDTNGYIDDVYGWNFINYNNVTQDDGERGHGTFVAGLIVGNTDDANRAAFANWKGRLMPVKVMDPYGRGLVSQVSQGIYYAASNGAHVMNMSLGGFVKSSEAISTLQKAVIYAFAHGVVVVASVGNNGLPLKANWQDSYSFNYSDYLSIPAYYPEVLKVGSVDPRGVFSRFSNFDGYGYFVTAPGGGEGCSLGYMLKDSSCFNILAPKASSYSYDQRRVVQHNYQRLAGTSMAAPHVAAVAALIKSHKPKLTNKGIMKSIVYSAKDAGFSGPDSLYGYGILDAAAALTINPGSFSPVEFAPLKRGFKQRYYAPSQNSLFGKSVLFPGNRDVPGDPPPESSVTIPGSGSIKISTPQTVEGWFKYNGDTNEGPPLQTLMRKSNQSDYNFNNYFPYWVYLNSQKQFVYTTGENDIGPYQESDYPQLTSKFFLQKNNWYHFAITFNGSISRVFLNGQLMDEIKTKYPIDDEKADLVLGYVSRVGFVFSGELDEFRISNIIRYKEDFIPFKKPFKNDSNTLGLWHFDGDVIDSSRYRNHGTSIGPIEYTTSTIPTE